MRDWYKGCALAFQARDAWVRIPHPAPEVIDFKRFFISNKGCRKVAFVTLTPATFKEKSYFSKRHPY